MHIHWTVFYTCSLADYTSTSMRYVYVFQFSFYSLFPSPPLPFSLPFSLPLSLLSSQEVDGESLLSLDPQMMVKLMDLKTGPALRIHRKIATLKRDFNIAN